MHSSLRTIDDMMKISDNMMGCGFTSYKNIFNMKHHLPKDKSHTLEEIAKLTGYKKKGLQTIFNKGVGAYHTNPLSVRKQVKSPEQWAMGRVYASINPDSKAYQVDKSHLIKGGMIGGMAKKYGDDTVDIRPGDYGFTGKEFQNINKGDTTRENAFIGEYITNNELHNELVDAINNKKTNPNTELPVWAVKYMDDNDIEDPMDILALLDTEETRIGFLSHKHGYNLPNIERKELIEEESESEEEPENEEEKEKMGVEDVDVGADYTNEFGNRITLYNNGAFNEVNNIVREDKSIRNKASRVGELIEEELGNNEDYHSLFDKIFDNKTPHPVYNSSTLNNPEYTDIFKEYANNENEKNKSLINAGKIKKKQDYYLFDFFVGNNEACELKSLSDGYSTYVKDGFIPLTETKINGIGTQFKPHYKNINGENKLQQVKCEINDFGVIRTIDTLKNENINYKILFFLKDGIYYYEPLKDENFIIKENGRGRLNYKKEKVDYGNGKVTYYYKIPPSKLIPVQKYTYNNIFK